MTNFKETEENEETLEANELDNESGIDDEDSGEEAEVEDSLPSESDDEGETDPNSYEARKARAESQINRLKEEKAKLKAENKRLKKGKEGSEEVAPTNTELMERTYLAANGLTDKSIQNEVLRLAHKFDMPINEALEDADIKGRADSMIKQKKAQQSVARGTGGAVAKSKGVSYYVDYFRKNSDFPAGTSNKMIAKVTDQLAKE